MQLNNYIESNDWGKVYELVNDINASSEYFETIGKYELAELSFCIWNLLDELGRYPNFEQSFYPNLEKLLGNAYNSYQKRFVDDNDLSCLMGYMISMFPENFPSLGTDYVSVKKIGEILIKEAYAKDSQNPFIKMLYNNSEVDRETILSAKTYIVTKFKDCESITEYFQRIL